VKLLFATHNAGKLRELRQLVGSLFEVVSLGDLPEMPEVREDESTFEGNARKKATAYARASGLPSLADDSGLCVDALGGRPGVLSARYVPGSDADRVAKLLEEVRGVPEAQRGAEFRCALSLALPDGEHVIETGRCAGRIGTAPRGQNGFGYDPIFVLPKQGRTMAELTSEEKSQVSHRGEAFRRMRPHLVALAEGEAIR
jgi:XTP/dITP diphosphohydrolase